jgi:hypothetical protein
MRQPKWWVLVSSSSGVSTALLRPRCAALRLSSAVVYGSSSGVSTALLRRRCAALRRSSVVVYRCTGLRLSSLVVTALVAE